jgi:hypothetical protein
MTHKLTVFEPGLSDTPGWAKLSPTRREWLQEKTSNIKKLGAMEGLAAASGAVELYDVKQGLHGEAMNLTDYIRTVFGASERTGWRKLDQVEQLISEGWTFIENKVRTRLKENRSVRRAGKAVKLTEDDGTRILFNTGRRILKSMKSLQTSADRRTVLKTVVGWWMEDMAIPGTLECKRLSIPDGVVAKVGYPKGRKRLKAA